MDRHEKGWQIHDGIAEAPTGMWSDASAISLPFWDF
jgi:hypothetical protein